MCLDVACINKNATKERMELELKKKKKNTSLSEYCMAHNG